MLPAQTRAKFFGTAKSNPTNSIQPSVKHVHNSIHAFCYTTLTWLTCTAPSLRKQCPAPPKLISNIDSVNSPPKRTLDQGTWHPLLRTQMAIKHSLMLLHPISMSVATWGPYPTTQCLQFSLPSDPQTLHSTNLSLGSKHLLPRSIHKLTTTTPKTNGGVRWNLQSFTSRNATAK